jgi:hypothetical protein
LAAEAADAAAEEAAGAAAGAPGAAAAAAGEPSAFGVDPVGVCGVGEPASTLSPFDLEATLEDPPEQAPPTRARALRSAT